MIDIQKTGNAPKKLSVMVYGPPGTGKTCFGGTGEPRFKTLIVNVEGGTLSLQEQAKRQGIADYDTTRVTKFEDLRRIYDFLRSGKHEYSLVVLDSGTEIQKVCMDHILATMNEKGQPIPVDKDGKPAYPPRERPVMSDWGYLNTKMTGLIRGFRDIPNVSFVMTALENYDKNDETGETRIIPLFQGGIKEVIDGYFDQVFYAFAKEVDGEDGKKVTKHGLLTRTNGKVRAKDRSGRLPLVVEPDFVKIFDTIFPAEDKQKEKQA